MVRNARFDVFDIDLLKMNEKWALKIALPTDCFCIVFIEN